MTRRSILVNRCGCGSCGACRIFRRHQVIAATQKASRCRREPREVCRETVHAPEDDDLVESPEARLRYDTAEAVYRSNLEAAAPFRTITTYVPWSTL